MINKIPLSSININTLLIFLNILFFIWGIVILFNFNLDVKFVNYLTFVLMELFIIQNIIMLIIEKKIEDTFGFDWLIVDLAEIGVSYLIIKPFFKNKIRFGKNNKGFNFSTQKLTSLC